MPKKSIFIITWIVILNLLLFDFIANADKTFLSLNYSWNEIKIKETFENVNIDTLSLDYLKIKSNSIKANSNQTFSLDNGIKCYFRATSIVKEDSTLIFKGIKWLNSPSQLNVKLTKFQIVDLPLKQKGTKTIITIGDSQMSWREGREFRNNLFIKNKNIFFVGSKKDIYGYPCETDVFIKIEELSDNIEDIEEVQNYILFIGAHDKKTDRNIIITSLRKVYDVLSTKPTTKNIFVITLPPSPILYFEEYNKFINSIFKKHSSNYENVVIIDLYDYLKDKQAYLMEDGVHLNKYGHSLLSNLILKELQ